MVKKVTITLTDEEYELMMRPTGLSQKPGSRAKSILMAWLMEKSYTKNPIVNSKGEVQIPSSELNPYK